MKTLKSAGPAKPAKPQVRAAFSASSETAPLRIASVSSLRATTFRVVSTGERGFGGTECTLKCNIEIYYLRDMPAGRRWVWFGLDLLVVSADLDVVLRQWAIDEAFADVRSRALKPSRRRASPAAA